MMPSRPPQSSGTANNNNSDPSATTSRSFTAFLVPPPPVMQLRFVVQLGNGVQLELAPSPTPFVFLTPQSLDSNGAANMDSDAMLRAMHELFMRSQNAPTGPPPTSKSFLDALPQKTWDTATCANDKYTDCAICLSEYEQADDVLTLPCSHTFHRECGLRWLVDHNVCPTCRYELPTQDDATDKLVTATPAAATASPTTPTDSNNASEQQSEDNNGNNNSEPEAEHEPALARVLRSLLGVRRERSPTFAEPSQPVRAVRQRVASSADNSDATVPLPGAVPADVVMSTAADSASSTSDSSDAALESLLEEEATRFVAEESAKHATSAAAAVNAIDADAAMFDDVELDELLCDTRPANSS